MKKLFALVVLTLILFNFTAAHEEETFAQAEEIIKQKISCDNLTNEQLEILGEHYMEQMHPGEAHELMDDMMGGEGSESLKQVHINMGSVFYCGENKTMSSDMMMQMMNGGMMGYGMMGRTNYGYGMTGNYSGYNIINWIFVILAIIVLVLLIFWLIKQIQKEGNKK